MERLFGVGHAWSLCVPTAVEDVLRDTRNARADEWGGLGGCFVQTTFGCSMRALHFCCVHAAALHPRCRYSALSTPAAGAVSLRTLRSHGRTRAAHFSPHVFSGYEGERDCLDG